MTLIQKPFNAISSDRLDYAKKLIEKYGRNSFCWQILNPGISLWISRDDQSVAGYVLHGNMRIVGGVPVTRPENLKRAAAEFEEDARKHGQRVCYFGAEDWLKDIFKNEKTHRIVLLGAQPTWDPRRWPEIISGKASVREMISYAFRRGVTAEETLSESVCDNGEYQSCLKEWLVSRKLPALKFLINPHILENSHGRRFFSARKNGELIGFLSLVPIVGRNGWLIEHIFRGNRAVKGMNELLIDSVMTKLANEGCAYATLGLVPLSKRAGLSYDMNPAWIRAAFNWLYSEASSFYNFNGLDVFKSKFKPHHWESVYAIVNKPRFSPVTFYRIAAVFCRTSPFLFGVTALVRTVLNLID